MDGCEVVVNKTTENSRKFEEVNMHVFHCRTIVHAHLELAIEFFLAVNSMIVMSAHNIITK